MNNYLIILKTFLNSLNKKKKKMYKKQIIFDKHITYIYIIMN